MTDLPTIPKNADQVAGLIKKFAPPLVGLSIGFGAGDLLGVGDLVSSFITKYISQLDSGAGEKISSLATIGVYLGAFFSFRTGGMISKAIAWACFGVAVNEALFLKSEVL